MSKILVTGSSGFVAHHRVQHLKNKGDIVIGVHNTHNDFNSNIVYKTDISEKDSIDYIVARERPDRIEHYASVAIVAASRSNPYQTYKTNVLGAVSVLDTAKKYNIPLLLMSTDKYYGSLTIAREDDRPIVTPGAYENSKLCQDLVGQSYREAGANITIVRSANIYGPGDINRRIIPNTIRDLQEKKQPVVFTNILGVRQYIYVTDFCDAVDTIIGLDNDHRNDDYNIGTNIQLSQKQVVETIIDIWNNKYHTRIKPSYQERPDLKEIPEQFLDWDKIHALGWEPMHSFRDGVEEILDETEASCSNKR